MEKIVSRCGYRCDLCLAFAPNAQTTDRRKRISDGWFKIFGFRIPEEEIACDCCKNDGNLIDTSCPVRPCVLSKGIDTCGTCPDFICDKLQSRMVDFERLVIERGPISEEDRELFVRPYESRQTLEELKEEDF